MRTEGLEPTCREALDPKSSASANFATSAHKKTLTHLSANQSFDIRLVRRNYINKDSVVMSAFYKLHNSSNFSENCVIFSDANIFTWMPFSASLTHNNISGYHSF